MKKKYVVPIVLICVTLFAYATSFTNDFVLLDDDSQVYENTLVQNLNFNNIETIFTSTVIGMYQPLVTFFFAIIASVFGIESASSFHTFSLFIHLINVFLVFSLGKKLLKDETKSILLALLFAIHPLSVEAVAWVSATSTVLFTFFFLSALLYYIRFLEEDQKKHYYLSLLLFLIGCFCKVQIIPFVGALFLVDYFYQKPFFTKRSLIQKLPFIIIALIFTFIAFNARVVDQIGQRPYSNIYFSGYQTTWYIIKNLVPMNLVATTNWPEQLTIVHHILTIAVLPLLYSIYYFRKNRLFVFGVLFFLFNVVLHIAIVSKLYAPYADRYAYLSSLGIWIALFSFFNKKQLLYSIGPFLFLLLFITKSQVKTWKNNEILFTRNIKYSPNALSYNNLGCVYLNSNRSIAKKHFLKAIELDSIFKIAYNNLGLFYINSNKSIAEKYFLKAIELDSKDKIAYNGLGVIYINSNPKKAASCFLKAIELDPKYTIAYKNLGLIYMDTDKEKAMGYLEKSIQLDPTDTKIYNILGVIYATTDKNKAITYFLKTLSLDPKNQDALNYLKKIRE
jgi:tetratricopeptide (TPR) repeat protein